MPAYHLTVSACNVAIRLGYFIADCSKHHTMF